MACEFAAVLSVGWFSKAGVWTMKDWPQQGHGCDESEGGYHEADRLPIEAEQNQRSDAVLPGKQRDGMIVQHGQVGEDGDSRDHERQPHAPIGLSANQRTEKFRGAKRGID
jgi:hypothetical protein